MRCPAATRSTRWRSRALGDRAPLDGGAPLPLPASLRQLVGERIPAIEPDVREALLAVAALS
jgi:hypothetical protein